MASLYVVRGRDQGKHFVLNGDVVRIGRDTHNHVQLFDSEASRNHAEIRFHVDGKPVLVDLSSSNGTQVNGERVTQHALTSGDRLEIGSTLLIYTGTGQPTAIEAASRCRYRPTGIRWCRRQPHHLVAGPPHVSVAAQGFGWTLAVWTPERVSEATNWNWDRSRHRRSRNRPRRLKTIKSRLDR